MKLTTAPDARNRSENISAVVPNAAPSLAVGVNPVVIVADVRILFVRVSAPASVASVQVVGKVTVPDHATGVASIIVLQLVLPATFSLPTAPALQNVLAPVMVCTHARDISHNAQKDADISVADTFSVTLSPSTRFSRRK